jgi:hypothetical protein
MEKEEISETLAFISLLWRQRRSLKSGSLTPVIYTEEKSENPVLNSR